MIGGRTMDHAEDVVPEALYMLVNLLCAGDNTDIMEDDNDDADKVKL